MNKKCQVFTPTEIVIELLNKVDYTVDLFGKKIIENACGDGNILTVIVERYITDCIKSGITIEKITMGLQEDIYGAEIDVEHYSKCIVNLNVVAKKYGLVGVKWNILNVDILKEDLQIKFDYVIGNPPYITYKDLDNETRSFVREKFEVCRTGKFDYCYAFIEASLKVLNENGKMSYLIPSSIFKNVFAQNLRDFLLPFVQQIYDYQTIKLFNVMTSSAIVICDKGLMNDFVDYYNVDKGSSFAIGKKNLFGKWEFSKNKEATLKETAKFSDFFNASITIATLYNKAFVVSKYEEVADEGRYIKVNSSLIERNLLKVAASPRSLNYNKNGFIIFPYYYSEGKLQKYNEEEFERRFPEGTKYLKLFSDELKERDSDKNVKWFEYGRTQALAHLNQEKLLLSTVVTKQVKVYELSEECIPYSGIYITRKGKFNLDYAKNILESESFFNYVRSIGINANGSSLRITAKDINNFVFPIGRE
ncbi:Eco57I restriction-modification methylase domain-containing protein [Paenibacillus sp. S150]|uniref:Eco57I restriction-modification methylase domain-containing protein n=1 Tax=Paenibacillus sp. S150 TaxID=2749826 RepID=UPI001C57908A|nr:N-6 DNA methylase [Paenibacillus sp. S150]MBW4080269.1 N-6 DNA methylase [Paenibacillus sp. S150]